MSAKHTPVHKSAEYADRLPILANARLFAAAADLLAALKGLLKEELAWSEEGSARFRAVATRRLNAAHRAVAKAEGNDE